jgi:hypothetical protein
MTPTTHQFRSDVQVADGQGIYLGRGTGFTIKEFQRRLNAFMKRRQVESHAWRKARKAPSGAATGALPSAATRH